jgi:peptide/nickel transport system substrate-binding protein
MLTTYIATNPPTLDAQTTKSIPARNATGHVMSRLYRHKTATDPNVALTLEVEPDLAASAESPDATTWTVKLRPDVNFQNIAPVNGHAVEAEDVKDSFDRAFSLPASAAKSFLDMIDESQIETPASDTVVFKLKYPYGIFLDTLANVVASWIYPPEVVAGAYDPAKQVIGSGPFSLEAFTPDVALSYKKNPNWFEHGLPYIDGEHVAIIPNPAQQLAQFTAGNVDVLSIGQNNLDAAKQANPKAAVVAAPDGNPYQIYGHMDDPSSPFADVRVRQAISMAIDRAAIGRAVYGNVYHNNAVLAFAKGKPALAPDQLDAASQYYTYNLDAAKKLVAESAAAGQLRKFIYPAHYPSPEIDTIAQMVVPMLNAAGFKIELTPVDYATQFVPVTNGALYGHYDADAVVLLMWFSGGNTAEEELSQSLAPGGAANHSHVVDQQLATMISKMLSLLDAQQRLKAVQDIQRYAADKMYYIAGIPSGDLYTLVQPRVRSYAYSLGPDVAGTETSAKLWLAS